MYSKTWFALPLAVKLSEIHLAEDILLDGDLQDEYTTLIKEHATLKKNKDLNARIFKTYLKGSNLWAVTCDILELFHLIPTVFISENGAITLELSKGSAWKRGEP